MLNIKFSHMYSKLHRPKFTTLRRHTGYKERYYMSQIGQDFVVLLIEPGEPAIICRAILTHVIRTHYSKLSEKFIAYDTDGIWQLPRGGLLKLHFRKVE